MSMLTPTLREAHLLHPESYPTIAHLDDILPHIAHNRAIRAFDDGTITNIRYLINDPDVFKTAHDLECRGLIFDSKTGALLSRPFHKFFNIANLTTATTLMQGGPVVLFDKLDGSMVAGFVHNGQQRLHTKGGFTAQSARAEQQMSASVRALITEAFDDGYTPIFEWTSPDNRIIIAYDTADFVLLALRHRTTGAYDEARANALARAHNVRRPTVYATVDSPDALMDWMAKVGAMTGIEGVVAVGPDGQRGKIKTRAYLSVHKALSMISIERHAFRAVVDEIDDDLMPLLPPEQAAFFAGYARAMRARMLTIAQDAKHTAAGFAHHTGAQQAAAIKAAVDAHHQPLVFAAAKGKEPVQVLVRLLGTRTGSQTQVDAAKEAYGLPDWTPPSGLFLQD